MLKTMTFGLLAALALAAPALAFDPAAMTEAERAAFRAEVRAYLIENPEVLMEAIAALEARQAEAQAGADSAMVAANADAIFNDGISWVGGDPEGDVTLVEFMDYRCGYCRKAHAEVEALVNGDGNIRYILKEYPILGEQSDLAARFAVAVQQVAGPELYKQAHDALMTFRGDFTSETLARLATTLGLDSAAIMAAMQSPEVAAVIAANHELAAKLQVNGTPTFVLGDQMLRGYVPLAGMQQMLAEVRAE